MLVRHPVWIANSALLVLVVTALAFAYFSRPVLPEHARIEPKKYVPVKKEPLLDIDIEKIYTNDIFGTYRKQEPIAPSTDYMAPFPEPPQPQQALIPPQPTPQFLDPLNITLRGIIVIGYDPDKNNAIIMDNKTNRESVYKVGDVFEDATLIRILSNKVVFLRSNGQQEVLYLQAEDVKNDAAFQFLAEWELTLKQTAQNTYQLDPEEFVKRVQNVGQLIDILELTTIYQKGKSVGVRIGQLDEKSFGAALGLEKGDIITAINNVPTASLQNRMAIYNQLTRSTYGDIVTIKLNRAGQEKIITITLTDLALNAIKKTKEPTETAPTEESTLPKQKNDEKINILKEKYKFAPTLRDIRKRERRNMLERGSVRRH